MSPQTATETGTAPESFYETEPQGHEGKLIAFPGTGRRSATDQMYKSPMDFMRTSDQGQFELQRQIHDTSATARTQLNELLNGVTPDGLAVTDLPFERVKAMAEEVAQKVLPTYAELEVAEAVDAVLQEALAPFAEKTANMSNTPNNDRFERMDFYL